MRLVSMAALSRTWRDRAVTARAGSHAPLAVLRYKMRRNPLLPNVPTIQLHGVPLLVEPGRADTVLSAREAGLLAWLHFEGPSPRARIAGLLWPAGDESKARANLRQTLVRLKRAAGEVLTENDGVLSLAPEVSVAEFDLEQAGGSEAQRLLGPLEFDDAPGFAEWLATRREAAGRERRRLLLARARAHRDAGDWDAALAAAEMVLVTDNAVEDAHRLRMEVFYLRGDRAAAVTAWDDCRDALRAAYGISPSAATNELGRLVLAAEAAGQRHAAAVQARQALAAATLPAALRRPPMLVGREKVLDDIARAFALGRGVVLAGPGGIGKSRLLAEAAAAMDPTIVVGARPGDVLLPGSVASRLVAAAVERFAPDLDVGTRADIALLLPGGPARGTALASALERRRVLASVARTMLACHTKGMRLVAVDDLQFADDLSMEAIAVVVGGWLAQPPDSAALPLFGCRPDELRPAAAALVAMLAGSRMGLRVDVQPLAVPEVQALLESLPLQESQTADTHPLDRAALACALHERVGGNPAFVLESVKALWLGGMRGWQPGQALEVPATLKESLRQRMARLSSDALQMAQLAALAQEDFSLALASSAMGRAPLALAPTFAELESAQVLEGARFSHDLVAEAAREAVPAALVQPLHQLVAEHLRAHGGAPARIAWHLQQAGAEAEAVPWHLAAAHAARDRWQLAEAARHYESAAQGLARRHREGLGPPAALGGEATVGSLAMIWLQAARWRTAVSDATAALAALDHGLAAATTPGEILELQASRVVVLHNGQRLAESVHEAEALAAQLHRHPDALPPERAAAALWACVATVQHSARPEATAALCEQLRQRCEAGPPRARQTFRLAVGTCLNWLGHPLAARAELAEARALADGFEDHGAVVNVTHQQARNALLLGDLAAARAAADAGQRAVQLGGYGRSFRLHSWALQALVAVAAGEPGRAWAALQSLDAERGDDNLHDEAEVGAARALVSLALGPTVFPDEADQALPACEGWWAFVHWRLASTQRGRQQALDALARRWPADHGVMGFRRRILAATLAPPDQALARSLVAELRGRGLLPLLRRAEVAAARAALATGAHGAAIEHARQALALAAHADPWTDEPASVWVETAAVLREAQAGDEAGTTLARGRAWLLHAADTLPGAAERRAWLQVHPLHRALLASGSA
jgi:DNA-binding SARP family transcriptional activator/energy-coupling factor transporter ATP-binding protein EcfA2